MKKSLLALAALGAFASTASAQSSVTLFGIVDAAWGRVSAGGRSVTGVSNSGINSSRLGFRGVEDLGGGLRAGFWIEGQLTNDDGNAAGQTWQRRSTVSLLGGFGEIRLGRDYTPHFWNTTFFDPFGTNGVGSAMTPNLMGAANTAANASLAVRSNNSIGYFLPGGLGGLYGQVMLAFGEQPSNAANKDQNDYFGFRVGYAGGPLSAAFAYGKTDGATTAADLKYTNWAVSYDLGAVKPMFQWNQEKAGSGTKVTGWLLGATAPMGQGEFRIAYSDYDVKNSSNDWKKFALGYVYNLSKRSAMFASYARVSNSGAQNRSVANNGLSAGAAAAGGNSTGFELGVRHVF
jgi:predicted porin